MEFWVTEAFNGISYGALLFLLASGLSLIFGLMRIVNLSHGSYFLLGEYVGLTTVWQTKSFMLALVPVPWRSSSSAWGWSASSCGDRRDPHQRSLRSDRDSRPGCLLPDDHAGAGDGGLGAGISVGLRHERRQRDLERAQAVAGPAVGVHRSGRLLLPHPGLAAALEWDAQEFHARTGTPC